MMSYFEKVKPAENMKRFYRIHMMPTLFGDWAVVREWGHIGSAGRVKEEWFEDLSKAAANVNTISKTRFTHGYRRIGNE